MRHVALIYAAGKGSRLHPLTDSIPKCLLKVNGKALIEHQVEACKNAGIKDIVVVLGYKGEAVKQVLGRKAKYVWNKKFETTQTLYSLHCSRKICRGKPIVHIDGDNYFHPAMLKRIIDNRLENVQLIDFSVKLDEEATKALVQHNKLCHVGKDIPLELASGECVGILKLGLRLSGKLYEQAKKSVKEKRYSDHVYNGLNPLFAKNSVSVMSSNGLYWVEIDFINDLERAQEMARFSEMQPKKENSLMVQIGE